ncbi:thioether cross-link-forming SCIFF peptide maturase [Dehalobacterium formicoaceticum]|uniref:Thioether cross-link-forming SCIFF peptide maturase n=1 Tax=Dehalobacterium formicoaceticum TaxID=51515 RepID=A0ABT1Y753_9FIRM|nr:thioether cross-link-forming SCIFF peptide maturase [Dehalobacterium formicoaceticum]MCR6545516.1 thioether cross-link-forming SCIFF peptide maturase [Dehalobacterium formicoaceticum]
MGLKLNIMDTHKFEIDGTKILLDVNSGSIHIIDDPVWAFHELLIKRQGDLEQAVEDFKVEAGEVLAQDIKEEFQELIAQGQLFSQDEYRDKYSTNDSSILKSLCLNVSHDCNLRCAYCFAGSGNFGGQRLLMSVETGKKALDYLLKHSGNRKHCEVDFFGGEPLLNIDVVKELIAYGREQGERLGKEIKFTLTTNGVALDEKTQEYLNREGISVVLSLDGRREVNDRVRKFPSGKGSYEIIHDHFKKFVESRNHENYYLRGTFTGWNKDFFQDARHLVEEGYRIISLEPVVTAPEDEYALKETDLPVLKEEYFKLARYYRQRKAAGKPFQFFHFNLDLTHGPCLPKRLSGCGAGYEYLVVTPEGDFYPCHQFVGREEYKMGSLEVEEVDQEIGRRFREAHIYHKPACRECWARFYCSGGCHANADAANHNILEPYQLGCELEKIRLECAIWLQVIDS